MPGFGYLCDPTEIVTYVEATFGMAAIEESDCFVFANGELVVYRGNQRKQETPSVSVLASASRPAKEAFSGAKKQYEAPEREVILSFMGRSFYREYYGEEPPQFP